MNLDIKTSIECDIDSVVCYEAAEQFVDEAGRTIEIREDFDVFSAQHDGREIGAIEFEDDEDGNAVLYAMNVDEAYQRAGIATALMRRAVEVYGKDFGRPGHHAIGGRDARSQDYLTQEGAAFLNYCIRQGIIEDIEPKESSDFDELD